MESEVESKSRICPVPPGSKMGLNWHLKPRTVMAVSLIFMLTTTGLVYYLMRPFPPPPSPPLPPLQLTPHGAIAIDGDANFLDTALLEGWPGDGSPGNPFIIDGLYINNTETNTQQISDLGIGHCITVSNTRVSFTIRNCNLTGASWYTLTVYMGVGIKLENVTNGELVNNTCNSNRGGILLVNSHSNTVVNNTCNDNVWGISLRASNHTTVTNNICNKNWDGINLDDSHSNTVANNTCNSNGSGIRIGGSTCNTVASNTCNNNTDFSGIELSGSDTNTVADNTCTNNIIGIDLIGSDTNTVADNTCNNNTLLGISLASSHLNTVGNNTCNNNWVGIYFQDSHSNTVVNNTFLGNTEQDIYLNDSVIVTEITEEFGAEEDDSEVLLLIGSVGYMGFMVITLLGGMWIVGKRVSKGE